MNKKIKDLFQQATLEEMKEALFFFFFLIYSLLNEKEQQSFFLELFKGEKGKVPSMVYY